MVYEDSFEHHGIKGQKWGVRRTPEQLGYSKSDSPMTKRVKKDYNSMDNREFKGKYGVSKKKYAKRVEKYGDPYMNSPYSKRLQRKHSKELAAQDDKARTEMWYNRDKYTTKQLKEMNDRMQTEINYKNNLDRLHPETASRETTRKYARMFATGVAGFIVAKASSDLGKFIYSQGKDAVIEALRHGDDTFEPIEQRTEVDYMYKDTFEHHGIKGQRWGVRRYQNADGSLTPRGQKHYTKKFKKYMSKGDRDLSRAQGDLYVESYNRAADKMNNGVIEAYNKAKEKRYGENFADRPDYISDYEKVWNKQLQNELTKSLLHFASQNKNYQKAYDLNKKYGLDKSDSSLKSQTDALNDAMKNRKG